MGARGGRSGGGAACSELEKRKEASRAMVYLTPLIAVVLTMVDRGAGLLGARLRRAGGGLGDVRRAADRPGQVAGLGSRRRRWS